MNCAGDGNEYYYFAFSAFNNIFQFSITRRCIDQMHSMLVIINSSEGKLNQFLTCSRFVRGADGVAGLRHYHQVALKPNNFFLLIFGKIDLATLKRHREPGPYLIKT